MLELENKKEKFFYWAEMGFKLSFLILCLLNFNSVIFGSRIMSLFVVASVVLAAVTFIYRVINYKAFIHNSVLWILIAFLISYFITMLMFMGYGFMTPLKTLVWLGLQIALLFATDERKSIEEYEAELHIILYTYLIFVFIYSAASIGVMISGYSKIRFYEGIRTITGFVWGRLWGVYTDPNYGSVMAVIAILISSYLISASDKRSVRIGHIINILLQICYITFSDSRTGLVAGFFAFGIYSYCIFVRKFINEKSLTKNAACLFLAICVAVSFFGVTRVIRKSYNYIVSLTLDSGDDGEIQEEQEDPNIMLGREQDIENDISNRRFDLWESAIETVKEEPIFGISFDNIVPYVKEHLPETYLINNDLGTFRNYHSAWFNILVGQGLLGMLIFIAATVVSAVKVIRVLSKNIHKSNGVFYSLIFSTLMATLASSMFLQELVYTLSPNTFLFWVLLGIAIKADNEDVKNA